MIFIFWKENFDDIYILETLTISRFISGDIKLLAVSPSVGRADRCQKKNDWMPLLKIQIRKQRNKTEMISLNHKKSKLREIV